MSIVIWGEILSDKRFLGGEIEISKPEVILQGPIKGLRLQNGKVFIETEWTALLCNHDGLWHEHKKTNFSYSQELPAQSLEDGRVFVSLAESVTITLHPKRDPLRLSWERVHK